MASYRKKTWPHIFFLYGNNETVLYISISVLQVSALKSLKNYVKLRVGSALPHEGGVLVDVEGVVRHPKFEEEPVPHADVALLKLSTNLGMFDSKEFYWW